MRLNSRRIYSYLTAFTTLKSKNKTLSIDEIRSLQNVKPAYNDEIGPGSRMPTKYKNLHIMMISVVPGNGEYIT